MRSDYVRACLQGILPIQMPSRVQQGTQTIISPDLSLSSALTLRAGWWQWNSKGELLIFTVTVRCSDTALWNPTSWISLGKSETTWEHLSSLSVYIKYFQMPFNGSWATSYYSELLLCQNVFLKVIMFLTTICMHMLAHFFQPQTERRGGSNWEPTWSNVTVFILICS